MSGDIRYVEQMTKMKRSVQVLTSPTRKSFLSESTDFKSWNRDNANYLTLDDLIAPVNFFRRHYLLSATMAKGCYVAR